jgi:tetratricopeptide (TPR) repeat protein
MLIAICLSMSAQEVNSVCVKGDLFFAKHKFDYALEQYDSCYSNDQTNVEYLRKKAACTYKLGRLSETKLVYLQLFEYDSCDIRVLYMLSQISAKQGEIIEAIDYNRKLISIDSSNAYYYKREAELSLKIGDVKSGIVGLEKSHSLNPYDIEVLLSLAKVYEELKFYRESDVYVEKAYLLDSNNIKVLMQRAQIAYKNKEYELVIERGLKYLNQTTDTSYYQMKLLGIAYFHMEDFSDAIDILEKVIAENYETEVVYYYLGIAYKNVGAFIESQRCFENAIEKGVSKNISNYYTNLAILFEEQGMYQKSIRNYQISYKYSNNKTILYHLARNYDAYYKDKSTSLDYFERYLAMNDTNNMGFMRYSEYKISELKKAIHFDVDSLIE